MTKKLSLEELQRLSLSEYKSKEKNQIILLAESVAWSAIENINNYIEEKLSRGYKIIAIEQTTSSIPLHTFPININEKYILIFGNEVHGVSDEIIKLANHFIEIPQFGTKHSLNVSVAAGIVAWHFLDKILTNK